MDRGLARLVPAISLTLLLGVPGLAQNRDEIDFDRARTLLQKRQQGQTLSSDEEDYLRRAMELRQRQNGGGPAPTPRDSVGLTPLTELAGEARYKDQDGGLYGHGRNEPPASHANAARRAAGQIVPRNAEGRPADDGLIGLVAISMSNATQEFSRFKEIADRDGQKSPRVAIVDCAQGGQAMAQWVDPRGRPWQEADRRLTSAKVSPQQVQVAWIKLANVRPTGELDDHVRKLQDDTQQVVQNAKSRFPNLQIAYLGSRIYGGYGTTVLNPEPYAYEGAFAVRRLIQDQVYGSPDLNSDPQTGEVKAPLLLWGPYLWADGVRPRQSDGLTWTRADFAADGTHPSQAGRQKVAEQLLKFFKEDPLAKSWFLKEANRE